MRVFSLSPSKYDEGKENYDLEYWEILERMVFVEGKFNIRDLDVDIETRIWKMGLHLICEDPCHIVLKLPRLH